MGIEKESLHIQLTDLCSQLAEKTMELLNLSNVIDQNARFNQVKSEVKSLQQSIAKLRAAMPGIGDCNGQ
jgi:hypothetical protein